METPGFCVTILRYASGVAVELRWIMLQGSVRTGTGGLATKSLQRVFDRYDDADLFIGQGEVHEIGAEAGGNPGY